MGNVQYPLHDRGPAHCQQLEVSFCIHCFGYIFGVISAATMSPVTKSFNLPNLLERNEQKSVQRDGCLTVVVDNGYCCKVLRYPQEYFDQRIIWARNQLRVRLFPDGQNDILILTGQSKCAAGLITLSPTFSGATLGLHTMSTTCSMYSVHLSSSIVAHF